MARRRYFERAAAADVLDMDMNDENGVGIPMHVFRAKLEEAGPESQTEYASVLTRYLSDPEGTLDVKAPAYSGAGFQTPKAPKAPKAQPVSATEAIKAAIVAQQKAA